LKKCILYYFAIIALLLADAHLHAQNKTRAKAPAHDSVAEFHVGDLKNQPESVPTLADSAIGPVIDSSAEEENSGEEIQVKYPIDTVLISRLQSISPDSLRKIKKEKGYYYQSWLDSLLRAQDYKRLHAPKEEVDNWPDLTGFFKVVEIILWLGAAALLIFIVYSIFGRSRFFSSNKKNVDAKVEFSEEDSSSGNYEKAIAAAEAAGDYRLAVRFLFLQGMAALESRGRIRQSAGKTNAHYREELKAAPAEIRQLFDVLVRQYEYIWYGYYPLTMETYDRLKKNFLELSGHGV
jgi:hypothetical protein